jgi:hypothetical protein
VIKGARPPILSAAALLSFFTATAAVSVGRENVAAASGATDVLWEHSSRREFHQPEFHSRDVGYTYATHR